MTTNPTPTPPAVWGLLMESGSYRWGLFYPSEEYARHAINMSFPNDRPVQLVPAGSVPAWHPKPTGPGWWLCSIDRKLYSVDPVEIDLFSWGQWYGPIPEPPTVSEPKK